MWVISFKIINKGQTKLCHHPPPPTTSQDISTNTHHNPLTATTFFIKNPLIRISRHCLAVNLNSWPAIAKKLFFLHALYIIIFTTYTRNGFKKFHCERTFILCETNLVLIKDKCSSVENILVLKFDKAILKK